MELYHHLLVSNIQRPQFVSNRIKTMCPLILRFKTLTRNIRCRRGEKVAINLPVFQDEHTRDPHEILVEQYGAEAAMASKPGHIYMDAMGFGMGQSCLQVRQKKSKIY